MKAGAVQFLSQEWLDLQRNLLRTSGASAPGLNALVQFKVSDGASGDFDYWWKITDGILAEATVGTVENPDVSIKSTLDDARAIQSGELSASVAFMQGRLKVAGNMNVVLALLPLTSSPEFLSVNDQLRDKTDV